MFTRGYRSFSLFFFPFKAMIFYDFPMFLPCFFPWVSPWVSDGFFPLKAAACKEDGTASGDSTGGLVPAGRAKRSSGMWDVAPVLSKWQNHPKYPKMMGQNGTLTYIYLIWARNIWCFIVFYAWSIWCKEGEHTHIYIYIYIYICIWSNWFFGFKHLLLIDI